MRPTTTQSAPWSRTWFRRRPRLERVATHLDGVLGTVLEIQVLARTQRIGQQAILAALDHIDRLERGFSRFDSTSELNRWLRDPGLQPSVELSSVLRQAESWRVTTHGAFHPGSEALTNLWRDAAPTGSRPTDGTIQSVLEHLNDPIWSDQPGFRPSVPLNLNAIAKGYIVDRAAQMALDAGANEVLVNIGGDLRHIGQLEVPVSVMNPLRPHDNAAPVSNVPLCNRGMATSGGSFRGFHIGSERLSHLIDPRNGVPLETTVGASVIAPNCMIADVLATAFCILEPDQCAALALPFGASGLRFAACGEVSPIPCGLTSQISSQINTVQHNAYQFLSVRHKEIFA